jgi:AcrR family transcriptional regulator
MKTPHRILKAQANDIERAPDRFNQRDRERHERILRVATPLFVANGRAALTTNGLAIALDIPASTFRRHFVDVDELLGVILTRHLAAISKALGVVPFDSADLPKARRAAYMAYTHTDFHDLTDIHRLLVRDRHLLPPDVREGIDATIAGLALTLAGPSSHYTLQIATLLDAPGFNADMVEAMIATLPAKPMQVRAPAAKLEAVKPNPSYNHDPYAGMRPAPGNPPNRTYSPDGREVILESHSSPYQRNLAAVRAAMRPP